MTSIKKIIGKYCYFISHRLGDGVSSEVYRGFHQETKQAVAIKIIPKAEHCKFDNISMAEAELHVLQELSGQPSILQLHFNTQTKNNIYIVTQLCEKGSLADVIKLHSKIPEAQALKYLKQLIRGYKAIADHQYIHRDIKPSNLLVNAQDDIFIGDFGLCIKTIQINNNFNQQEGQVGSPYYMAPEIINPVTNTSIKYTNKSDIWAIGITFYEMLYGRTPWKAKSQSELINSILSFEIENQSLLGFSKISQVFLKRSLCKDPQRRMGLKQMTELLEEGQSSNVYLQQQSKLNSENEQRGARSISLQECTEQAIMLGSHLIHKQHEILLPQRSNKDILIEKYTGFMINQQSEAVFDINRKEQIEVSAINHNKINNNQTISKVTSNLDNQTIQKRYRKTSFQENCHLELPFKAQTNKKQRKASQQINCEDLSEFNRQNKIRHQGKTLQELLTDLESPGVKQKSCSTQNIIERGDVSEMESGILKQLQGHINYFRLILKIWRRVHQTLKVNDNGIQSFKTCLLYLFSTCINQARSLSHIKGYLSTQISQFKQSQHYQSFIQLLDNYERRYQRQLIQYCILPDQKGDRDFLKLLSYIMNILYQNIKAIENDQEELNRKKILIFILEDLIPLGKAFIISKQDNWQTINKKLDISLHLEEKRPERISIEYWKEVKDRFFMLTKDNRREAA